MVGAHPKFVLAWILKVASDALDSTSPQTLVYNLTRPIFKQDDLHIITELGKYITTLRRLNETGASSDGEQDDEEFKDASSDGEDDSEIQDAASDGEDDGVEHVQGGGIVDRNRTYSHTIEINNE